jgi:HSP20 family protein
MDRLFDDFFDLAPFSDVEDRLGAFSPSVDVTEIDNQVQVTAELPGLTEDDIDLSLSQNVLTIRGEKKEEQEERDQNYHRIERSYGSFQRNIPLPVEVEAEQVEASFKNGVLTVTMPKTAQAQQERKKIEVKSE